MKMTKMLFVITAGLLSFAGSSRGQEHHFTVNVGGGYTPFAGKIGQSLDNGWNLYFGGGYAFTNHFEVNLEGGYNSFGLTQGFIRSAGTPGGNAHIWSVTADPKLRLGRERRLDTYIVGGVGYYWRTINFTRPTVSPVAVCDFFFGCVGGLAPTTETIGTFTEGGFGGSLGAGFDFKLGSGGARFFTEVRYHYADTGRIPTRMVPITFGISW